VAYDVGRNLTILFGGQADTGGKYWEALNETWAWDGANWQQQFPPTLPPARWGANMAYDHARKSIVLFGGAAGGGFREDTWLRELAHISSTFLLFLNIMNIRDIFEVCVLSPQLSFKLDGGSQDDAVCHGKFIFMRQPRRVDGNHRIQINNLP